MQPANHMTKMFWIIRLVTLKKTAAENHLTKLRLQLLKPTMWATSYSDKAKGPAEKRAYHWLFKSHRLVSKVHQSSPQLIVNHTVHCSTLSSSSPMTWWHQWLKLRTYIVLIKLEGVLPQQKNWNKYLVCTFERVWCSAGKQPLLVEWHILQTCSLRNEPESF